MKKIIKRIVCLGFTLVLCCCSLCACVGSKYGATLITGIKHFMREDFLEENRTRNVGYYISYYDEEEGIWKEKHAIEEEGPPRQDFIVNNEEEYLRIFKDTSSIAVDFETQMLVVYMYTTVSSRPLVLTKMKVEGNELFVSFKERNRIGNVKDSHEPGQGCFAIVMDKYDITSAQFVEE